MHFQRALIVEDHPQIVFLLRPLLRSSLFIVDHVVTCTAAIDKLHTRHYDLVVLDRNLPDGDGADLLPVIQDCSLDTKTLVLSERGLTNEKVDGLRRGADDYLAKPFAGEEFSARVQALMRRATRILSPTTRIGKGALLLREARLEYGKTAVQLSEKEVRCIDLMVHHPQHQLSREQLASTVWTMDHYPSTSSIDTFMKRLRDKLSPTPVRIRTRYNLGYELSIQD